MELTDTLQKIGITILAAVTILLVLFTIYLMVMVAKDDSVRDNPYLMRKVKVQFLQSLIALIMLATVYDKIGTAEYTISGILALIAFLTTLKLA